MSFSSEVKEELAATLPGAMHCRTACLAAILTMCGRVVLSISDRVGIRIVTENPQVAKTCCALIRKSFGITPECGVRAKGLRGTTSLYTLAVFDHDASVRILETCCLLAPDGEPAASLADTAERLCRRSCCKKAFIRGAFLSSGSVSDPRRSYHYEITCADEERAAILRDLLRSFDLDAKVTARKGKQVVYLKEGEQIADALNVMGAHKCLMELENVRILREISNSVNRQVNCETANLHKTVGAAVRQTEDIEFVRDHGGLGQLPEKLRAVAELRLENPDASLQELGEMLPVPVGKSGVNHRLRKISEFAEHIRSGKGGEEEWTI